VPPDQSQDGEQREGDAWSQAPGETRMRWG
jgi:hypothetical protein